MISYFDTLVIHVGEFGNVSTVLSDFVLLACYCPTGDKKKAGQPCWESGLLCNCMFDDCRLFLPTKDWTPNISTIFNVLWFSLTGWIFLASSLCYGRKWRHPSLFISAVRLWMELSWLYFPHQKFFVRLMFICPKAIRNLVTCIHGQQICVPREKYIQTHQVSLYSYPDYTNQVSHLHDN